MQRFNGTIWQTESLTGTRTLRVRCVDELRISSIARRPVSGLWSTNYTTNSSTEAMVDGNRYYWKVRGLDQGGEQ